MHRGYIKLFRRLKDSDMWTSEKFTRGQAWVDLIMLANHKPGFFRVRGVRVDVNRGQLAYSELTLARRWKWGRGKVRRFLSELESEMIHQIEQQKSHVTTLITILNYDEYQGNNTTDDTTNGQQVIQQTDNKRYTNKNDKNEKNEKNNKGTKIDYPSWLDLDLWKEFKKYRTTIKSPLTPHAEKLCLSDLTRLIGEGEDQTIIINQTIKSGKWKSFWPDKNSNGPDRAKLIESARNIRKFDGEQDFIVFCKRNGLNPERIAA